MPSNTPLRYRFVANYEPFVQNFPGAFHALLHGTSFSGTFHVPLHEMIFSGAFHAPLQGWSDSDAVANYLDIG